jgi:DGQHR domain-containing protein
MLNTTQLTIRIAAVQGAYGPRLATYATQVAPRSLEAFLGHDPRSRYWKKLDPELEDIYSQLQRTTGAERLRSIQNYIRRRFSKLAVICGAFPAISVAVTRPLKFQPFESGNDLAGAGTLHLDMSKSNGRVVLDGLARVSGVIELVELANDDQLASAEREALSNLLEEFSLPLVIFGPRENESPLTLKEMRQLFADFNFKQTSISPSMAISMDSSDIYIGATKKLEAISVIQQHGGVEIGRASLGSKSTALVVQQNLLRFVRAAAEGDRFVEAKVNVDKIQNARLTETNLDDFVKKLDLFLTNIAEVMGEQRFKETKNSIHLSGPGWSALGVVFYDLDAVLKVQNIAESARKIGEIDWRRDSEFWKDVMREKEVKGGKILTFVGGGTESRQSVRRKVHEYLGTWDKLQAALKADSTAIEAAAA